MRASGTSSARSGDLLEDGQVIMERTSERGADPGFPFATRPGHHDLAAAHGAGVRGAQTGRQGRPLLLGRRTHEQRGVHGPQDTPWFSTYSEAALAQGRPTEHAGPRRPDRDHLCPQDGHPIGAAAPRDGLRVGDDVLAPAARLAVCRDLGGAAPHAPRSPRGADRIDWSRASLDRASVPAKRGASAAGPPPPIAANRAPNGTF